MTIKPTGEVFAVVCIGSGFYGMYAIPSTMGGIIDEGKGT
jgi:hypothetical protein